MHYMQSGVEKSWDIARVHDSVSVLIYHKGKEAFILVKQFRPPVYLKNGDGFTYELCAGIVDKEKSLAEIVQEEILEETGYGVPLERIKQVTSFYTAVGFAGARQELFYVAVDDDDKVGDGGGVHTEAIEVFHLPVHKAKEFIFDEKKAKTPALIFAMTWWFAEW